MTDEPDDEPGDERTESVHAAHRRAWKRIAIAGGVLIVLGPVGGLAGTMLGMLASFETIERMKAPTPEQLAVGAHESQVAAILGMAIGALGVLALVFGLVGMQRASERAAADDVAPWT